MISYKLLVGNTVNVWPFPEIFIVEENMFLLTSVFQCVIHKLQSVQERRRQSWPNKDLANLITNLTKPSLEPEKTWARSRHYNQTGHPTPPPPPPVNFSKVDTWDSYTLTAQNFKGKTSLML